MHGRLTTDYGYNCRYNREVKKRGRVPAALAASSQGRRESLSQENQTNGHPRSPSPPMRSPNIGSANHFQTPASSHSTDSIVRPVLPPFDSSHTTLAVTASLTQSLPRTGQTGAYSTSPGPYSAPHAHLQLASLLDPIGESHIPQDHTRARKGWRSRLVPMKVQAILRRRMAFPRTAPRCTDSVVPAQAPGPGLVRSLVGPGESVRSFGASMAAEGSVQGPPRPNSLYRAPTSTCHYRCLDPVLPYLRDIIPASVACDLLDVYLTEPGSSLFRCASPYILTRIFRKKSVLHPTNPRQMTPALLATILWCAAQTADIVLPHVPGSRSRITNALYELATTLISERDPDRWRRIHGAIFSALCSYDDRFV